MSLLAPLFLLGLGLLALPIWLHRLQTDNPERESFGSTMFLSPSQKRVHVRRQLRHILLMILRLLFLTLLAFAFAKPILQTQTALNITPSSRVHIVVVDTSASMSAPDVFSDAVAQARRLVNVVGNEDAVELYRFGPNLVALVEQTTDSSSLNSALNALAPEPVVADNGDLMGALSRRDWSQPVDYQVHFISDMQKTALPNRYADMIPDLPADANISFNFYPVASDQNQNWAIDSVRDEGDGLRITVVGFETPERELDVSVRVGEAAESRVTINVAASARASLFIPAPEYEAAQNPVSVQLLVDDQLAADNQYHLVVDRRPAEPVLLLTSNPFAPAANYLSAVMSSVDQIGGVSRRTGYVVQAVSISEFDPRTLSRYAWLLIDDIGSVNDSLANALSAYVESGGALFAATGASTQGMQQIPVFGLQVLAAELSADNRFRSVSQVDQSHPVLNGLEGWSSVSFSRNTRVETVTNNSILATLENNDPLFIEQPSGKGRMLLFTSSLDNQWNDLPIKPLYVSLMSRIANYLSEADGLQSQFYAGDSLNLQEATGGAGQLVDPQGRSVLDLNNTSRLSSEILNQTGFYQLYMTSGESAIGVNLDPSESQLAAMDETEIARWSSDIEGLGSNAGPSSEQAAGSEQIVLSQDAVDSQQQLWYLLLCIAAVALMMESVLANLKLGRRSGATGVTPQTGVL